jgi:hypothetical protein
MPTLDQREEVAVNVTQSVSWLVDEDICVILCVLSAQFPEVGGFVLPQCLLVPDFRETTIYMKAVYIVYCTDHWVAAACPVSMRLSTSTTANK